MQIFNWVKKHILKKEERVIKIIENEQTLVMAVSPVEEIQFESDDIVTISQNNFIDTTDPLSIAKYKNNLRLLVDEVKEKKSVDKFKIIRDDDFFPTDWQWRVASQSTGIELSSFGLSYALKQIVASYNLGNYQNNPFSIPLDHDKLNEEMRKLGRYFAAIYMPVRFRSTKHFTINTPLSYTGEYNCVESDRNFTIIDNINNFLLSGYAYSADYRDAYLDVTHESLSISEEAIVLIAEDRYQTLLQDPKIASDLEKRHVIVYRGEEAVAINMILSQEGVLPARPGNRYMIYDDEIRTILESSMKILCANNGIEYSKGHGNIDGKGGHFSDLYDGYNREFYEAQEDFIAFLINCFPENTNLINYRILRDSYYAENLIKAVGVDALLQAIDDYNQHVLKLFVVNFNKYVEDRATITPEISQIFKQTVLFIRNFYETGQDKNLSFEESEKFKNLVTLFYHAKTVEDQLLAATEICNTFSVAIQNDTNICNSFSM